MDQGRKPQVRPSLAARTPGPGRITSSAPVGLQPGSSGVQLGPAGSHIIGYGGSSAAVYTRLLSVGWFLVRAASSASPASPPRRTRATPRAARRRRPPSRQPARLHLNCRPSRLYSQPVYSAQLALRPSRRRVRAYGVQRSSHTLVQSRVQPGHPGRVTPVPSALPCGCCVAPQKHPGARRQPGEDTVGPAGPGPRSITPSAAGLRGNALVPIDPAARSGAGSGETFDREKTAAAIFVCLLRAL